MGRGLVDRPWAHPAWGYHGKFGLARDGGRAQLGGLVPMANENVRQFTDANFEAEVLQSKEPVLVDFWAEWCMPCRMLTPTIEALANDFNGKAKVGKLDTDANKMVAVKYGITAIPTILIFKGGQPVKRLIGQKKKDELAAALNDAGAAAGSGAAAAH